MENNKNLLTDEQEDIIDQLTSEISKDVVEYYLFKINRHFDDMSEDSAMLLMLILDSLCKIIHKAILQCVQISPNMESEIFEGIVDQVKVYLDEEK
jgi:hypothetical protein